MKFKEFVLETSIYDKESTVDVLLNEFFEDKSVNIIDIKYLVVKECDDSNRIYLRVLVTYTFPLLIEV